MNPYKTKTYGEMSKEFLSYHEDEFLSYKDEKGRMYERHGLSDWVEAGKGFIFNNYKAGQLVRVLNPDRTSPSPSLALVLSKYYPDDPKSYLWRVLIGDSQRLIDAEHIIEVLNA